MHTTQATRRRTIPKGPTRGGPFHLLTFKRPQPNPARPTAPQIDRAQWVAVIAWLKTNPVVLGSLARALDSQQEGE